MLAGEVELEAAEVTLEQLQCDLILRYEELASLGSEEDGCIDAGCVLV